MTTTEVLLLRHGEAVCNLAGLVGGPITCTGLTTLGAFQIDTVARTLAPALADAPIHALYAGPRRRLRESGQILAQHLGIELRIEQSLDGPRHGQADGQPWRVIKDAFGGGPHTHPDQPWAPGSETWSGYLHRATTALHRLLTRHDGERIVLACHGETIMAAHALLLDLTPRAAAAFTIEHASLTWWQKERNRLGTERWLLRTHNDTRYRDDDTRKLIG